MITYLTSPRPSARRMIIYLKGFLKAFKLLSNVIVVDMFLNVSKFWSVNFGFPTVWSWKFWFRKVREAHSFHPFKVRQTRMVWCQVMSKQLNKFTNIWIHDYWSLSITRSFMFFSHSFSLCLPLKSFSQNLKGRQQKVNPTFKLVNNINIFLIWLDFHDFWLKFGHIYSFFTRNPNLRSQNPKF